MSNLSHGIKHWHWRTKGVEPWAKQWFTDNLVGTEASGVEIAEVTDVAHDMDEDEYRFESSLTSGSGREAEAFHTVAKKALADKLRAKFQQFPKAMIDTHGKDLLADAAAAASAPSPPPSTRRPCARQASSNVTQSRSSTSSRTRKRSRCGVATRPRWRLSAGPKWRCLAATSGGRSRRSSGRRRSSLRGGPRPGKKASHYGTLEMALEQGSNSTTLNLKLSGVPVGKEDETEQNLQTFYIRGLQAIGLGLLSSSSSSPSSLAATSSSRRRKPPVSAKMNRWAFANAGTFLASFGLILGLGAAFWYGPSGPGGKK
ncbi:SPOSA6832_04577, partial [Sporobolomyces salmonicolor]